MKKFIQAIILIFASSIALTPKLYGETFDCNPISRVPIVIKKSGHYCLNRDFYTDLSTGIAIKILSNNTILDLNSHVLDNTSAGDNTAVGISIPSRSLVEVRNGSVSGFGTGIIASSEDGIGSSINIHHMRVLASTQAGIQIGTFSSSVHNCQILSTGSVTNTETLAAGIIIGTQSYAGEATLPGSISITDNEILRFVPDGYEAWDNYIPPDYHLESYFNFFRLSAGIEVRQVSSAVIDRNRIVAAKYGVTFSELRTPSVHIGTNNILQAVETAIHE